MSRQLGGYTANVRLARSLVPAGLSVALTAALTACVGPARTASDYRLKARNSAKSALSAVATSELVAKLVRNNDAFATYESVTLDSAERDATSIESTFASIQPPDTASDHLRDELNSVLNDTSDAISSMRIAARRHEWSALLKAGSTGPT